MEDEWWLSTEKMTVSVQVKNGIIIEAAPVVRKFKGQPLSNLVHWMETHFKGFRMEKLNDR